MRFFEISMIGTGGTTCKFFAAGSCVGEVLLSLSSQFPSFKIDDIDSILEHYPFDYIS